MRLLGAVALLLTSVARADTAGSAAAQALLLLPERIEGLVRTPGLVDYEQRGMRGLGASTRYGSVAADGPVIDIYIYDANDPPAADGIGDAGVERQIAAAGAEIAMLVARRRYIAARRIDSFEVAGQRGIALFRCDVFLIEGYRQGQPGVQESFVCLGAQRGWFVKLRITAPPKEPGAPNQAMVRRFATAAVLPSRR